MFKRSPAANRRARASAARIESLENRCLLSGSVSPANETSSTYVAARIAHNEAEPARPSITRTDPADGATSISRDAFVAAYLHAGTVGAGIDNPTLSSSTAFLYKTSDTHKTPIPATVNTTGGGDAIILTPSSPLAANTQYTFVVTDGVKDTAGASFIPYTSTFTTGTAGGVVDTSVAFEKVALPTATNRKFISLTIGPDHRLYAGTMDGKILRFDIHSDGTLGTATVINTIRNNNGNQDRIIGGITFDPASTADNLILWVTHNHGALYGAPDWTGKLSRLSGSNLETYKDYIVNMPRSARDHMALQMTFSPSGLMYFCLGSMNGMGAPDDFWGNRPETLLSGNIFELDTHALGNYVTAHGPLDAQAIDGHNYDPFNFANPLRIYATGVRNAYDLMWHSNGYLYAPTNGSAPGSSTPAGPGVPAIVNNPQVEPDFLFRIRQGKYYGHPNPSQGHYVLNGGNPTDGEDKYQTDAYPVGTHPDAKWDPAVYSFGNNRSPDGIIEYKSNTFGGALKGSMIIPRFSGGDDLIILKPDSGGNIPAGNVKTNISGLTGFQDPLDVVEVVGPGYLYVIEYYGLKITLLKPKQTTTPPTPTNPLIGFTLLNAATDQPIGPAGNYSTFKLSDLSASAITFKAETNGAIGSIKWGFDNQASYKVEGSAPYSINGDDNKNFRPFTIQPGTHTITATAYSGSGASGAILGTLSHTFTLEPNVTTPNPPKPPTGNVLTGLTLLNAVNDTAYGPAENYANVNLSELGTTGVTFKAEVSGTIGSIKWGYDGKASYKVEGSAPYSINGDDNKNFRPFAMTPGQHTITATAYSGAGATGTVLGTITHTFTVGTGTSNPNPPTPPTPPANRITGFTLYNANTDTAIGAAENYPQISRSALGTNAITFKAETTGTIGSIRWGLDGNANYRVESSAPFSVHGDDNLNLRPFTVAKGVHTLTATAYSQKDAKGTVLNTLTLTFEILD